MPYKIRKVRNKNRFSVVNIKTKSVKAKSTTLKKAKSQVRLLDSIDK